MPVRALIIAVENYPALNEALSGTLTGTLDNAVAFRKWLIKTKSADRANILFCCEPRTTEATAGASKKEIRKAIIDLRDAGAGDTEELYFFFSGHGFAQVGLGRRATGDALLPSDYADPTSTGDLPIKHDEIVNLLQSDLGPGVHFHFVDVCRNERSENKFPAGTLSIPSNAMDTGQATAHLLYSTSHGDAARVDSGFGTLLVEGLHGTSTAKRWLAQGGMPRKLVVRFESLVDFIRSRLKTQRPDADPGDVGKDLIYEFRPPIEKKRCEIIVDNASAANSFDLKLGNSNQEEIARESFQGRQHVIQRLPDDYFIAVTAPDVLVEPSGWVHVDLYEDATKQFRVIPGRPRGPVQPPEPSNPARLDLRLPAGADGVIRRLATGQDIQLGSKNTISLPSGEYDLQVKDSDGWTVRRKTFELSSGKAKTIDLDEPPPTALHEEILKAVPGQHQGSSPDFSESLGGVIADQDPALWLAIMGASHIIKDPSDFSKLGQLPLADFSNVPPGSSALYLLVGLEEQFHSLQLGLSDAEQPIPRRWEQVAKVHGFEHLSHYMEVAPGGPALLSLALGQTSVITLTTALLPNRATLVTVTQDREGSMQVQQMMLPLGHLVKELPEIVRDRVFMDMDDPLRNIKFIVQAQRTFRKRLALDTGGPSRRMELNYLLYGKWLDPVMAALAAYEVIRRGLRTDLDEAVRNLLEYFPDFPDTIALVGLVTGKARRRIGWPLFLDGLRAFKSYQEKLPLPASRLDYRGMWTLWRGAVRNPNV